MNRKLGVDDTPLPSVRDRLPRLASVLVRAVELLCALLLLLSVWALGYLAEQPGAEQGDGTVGIALVLAGTVTATVLAVVVAGHAAARLLRTPANDRVAAVANGLPRLAAEVAVGALAAVGWLYGVLSVDHLAVTATTAFAAAVALHVAVDAWRFAWDRAA